MSEIISLVKGKEANGMPLAAAAAMAVLFIFCGITEYMHLQIVAQGVRDAVQEAVIAAVNDNFDDVYHGVREGYAGGYYPASGEGWEESLDYGDIYGRLDDLLGLSDEGNWHVKYLSGGEKRVVIPHSAQNVEGDEIIFNADLSVTVKEALAEKTIIPSESEFQENRTRLSI